MAKPKGKRGNKCILSIMTKERFVNDPLSYISYEHISYALRSDGQVLTKRVVIFKQIHEAESPEGIKYEYKWKKNHFIGGFVQTIDIDKFEEKFQKLGFSKVTTR